jgi:hypothetical protein
MLQGRLVTMLQADEVWGYVRCKEGTKTRKNIQDPDPEAGDAYCFIGLEPEGTSAWGCQVDAGARPGLCQRPRLEPQQPALLTLAAQRRGQAPALNQMER